MTRWKLVLYHVSIDASCLSAEVAQPRIYTERPVRGHVSKTDAVWIGNRRVWTVYLNFVQRCLRAWKSGIIDSCGYFCPLALRTRTGFMDETPLVLRLVRKVYTRAEGERRWLTNIFA